MRAGILEEILYHIHNWFPRESFEVAGCQIQGGQLPASVTDKMGAANWYRITGSYRNDGLHEVGDNDLIDETFDGWVTTCAIPRPVLELACEIAEWVDANEKARQKALESPYQSESFGGYTYTIRGDLTAQNGSDGLSGWQAAFASRLNPWRKIS